jgi:anthranilate phosphoribosyltransferase
VPKKPHPAEIAARAALPHVENAATILTELRSGRMLPGIQQHAALQALAHLQLAGRSIHDATERTARQALDVGASYADLAEVLDVSRQAVRQRYGGTNP